MFEPLLLDLPSTITTERLALRTPQTGDGARLLPALQESLPQLRRFLASLPWVAGEQTSESAERWCRNAGLGKGELITLNAPARALGALIHHRPRRDDAGATDTR